jgi:hypothetical protein
MKNGKSKKNSSVPSSVGKQKTAPPRPKLAVVKAAAAKAISKVKDVVAGATRVTQRAAKKTGAVSSKAPKKKDIAPPMPEPIVRSAMKKATSTPGVSPAAILAAAKSPKKISEVKVAEKVSESLRGPGAKSKAAASRRTPKGGAKVEAAVVVREAPLVQPEPIAAPVVRPSVGSSLPPPPPKPRFVREPRPVPVEIPPILLEPDHVPTEPAIAGPGARFALTPPMEHARGGAPEELPEAYGTEQIFLAARDPYCLFASWDLDAKQRARYNAASASGAVTIRLRRGFVDGPIELEVHTLPTSRDRFIEVKQPDTTFVAELGYHEKNSGTWKRISVSKTTTTPRDRMAPMIDAMVEAPAAGVKAPEPPKAIERAPMFESQPRKEEIIFATMEPWVAKQEPARETPQWQPSPEQPRWQPSPSPAPTQVKWKPKTVPTPKWSPVKTRALDELISLEFRRMQQGSLEIEEVLRRRILRVVEKEEAPSSIELAEGWEAEELVGEALGLPPAPSSLELAERPGAAQKGFWFKVNAELIIYGSTEPDAHVSIGGRPIRLRADGSFSFRFALPDGAYELPVLAIAPDRHDGRAAELRFSRATKYSGDVGAHPQDAALKPPSPANL